MGLVVKFRYRKINRLKAESFNKLAVCKRNLSSQNVEKSFEEFSKAVDRFFSKHFNMHYAFVYDELKKTIEDKEEITDRKKTLISLLDDMSRIKYGGRHVTPEELSELLDRFNELVETLSSKKREYVKTEPLLDFLIGKYLDYYDSLVGELRSLFLKPGTAKQKGKKPKANPEKIHLGVSGGKAKTKKLKNKQSVKGVFSFFSKFKKIKSSTKTKKHKIQKVSKKEKSGEEKVKGEAKEQKSQEIKKEKVKGGEKKPLVKKEKSQIEAKEQKSQEIKKEKTMDGERKLKGRQKKVEDDSRFKPTGEITVPRPEVKETKVTKVKTTISKPEIKPQIKKQEAKSEIKKPADKKQRVKSKIKKTNSKPASKAMPVPEIDEEMYLKRMKEIGAGDENTSNPPKST